MYLCICHKITEEQVKSQLGNDKSPKEIARSLGVGSDCGVCVIDGIQKLLDSSSAAYQPISDKLKK